MSHSKNQTLYESISGIKKHQNPDELFTVLGSERRRILIAVLGERSAPVTTDALAEAVASREVTDPTGDLVERVRVSLYHVHLPKLDDAGLVQYDSDRSVVYRIADGLEGVPFVDER